MSQHGGAKATERRASRVEIWQKQARGWQGLIYPQTAGRDTYFVGLNRGGECTARRRNGRGIGEIGIGTKGSTENAIRTFVEDGPEIKLAMEKGSGKGAWEKDAPIQNGFGIRLRLPYQNPKIVDIRCERSSHQRKLK